MFRSPLVDLTAAERNRRRVLGLQQAEAHLTPSQRTSEHLGLAFGWDKRPRKKRRAR